MNLEDILTVIRVWMAKNDLEPEDAIRQISTGLVGETTQRLRGLDGKPGNGLSDPHAKEREKLTRLLYRNQLPPEDQKRLISMLNLRTAALKKAMNY